MVLLSCLHTHTRARTHPRTHAYTHRQPNTLLHKDVITHYIIFTPLHPKTTISILSSGWAICLITTLSAPDSCVFLLIDLLGLFNKNVVWRFVAVSVSWGHESLCMEKRACKNKINIYAINSEELLAHRFMVQSVSAALWLWLVLFSGSAISGLQGWLELVWSLTEDLQQLHSGGWEGRVE